MRKERPNLKALEDDIFTIIRSNTLTRTFVILLLVFIFIGWIITILMLAERGTNYNILILLHNFTHYLKAAVLFGIGNAYTVYIVNWINRD